MADRLDLKRKSKNWGIEVAEQAVRNRGFLFQHSFQFPHIEFPAGNQVQESYMVQTAGRNFASDDQFGTAEKVSLEVGKPHIPGLMKLRRRFQFFRQHLA